MLEIHEVRFAESVKLHENKEEKFINLDMPKFARYRLYLDDTNFLWIFDQESRRWFGTSQANLRSVTTINNPFFQKIGNEEYRSKRHTTRASKKN